MIQLGELGTRVNDTWPEYEADLKANDVEYVMYEYSDAHHGFDNDSTARYDEESVVLAWSRTLEFFHAKLT